MQQQRPLATRQIYHQQPGTIPAAQHPIDLRVMIPKVCGMTCWDRTAKMRSHLLVTTQTFKVCVLAVPTSSWRTSKLQKLSQKSKIHSFGGL
jgi:hypothetical protein